uniref:LolA family protein n=2 Tax=Prevotella heparinolytica TaxID=28113 RepID=UPI00359FAB1F
RLKSLYKVVLTATERKTNLQCIILYVTRDTYRPTHVSMAQRGGDAAVIIINSYQTGETYPDSLFVFDKKAYPTAELIDLR